MSLDWITSKDIIRRLLRRRRHWFQGSPVVRIAHHAGNRFGYLVFNFGKAEVAFGICMQDPDEILRRANLAIDNIDQILDELEEEELYS